MLAAYEMSDWKLLYGAGVSYFNIRNRLMLVSGSDPGSEWKAESATVLSPALKVAVNNKKVEFSYIFLPSVGDGATGSGTYHQVNFSILAFK